MENYVKHVLVGDILLLGPHFIQLDILSILEGTRNIMTFTYMGLPTSKHYMNGLV